MPDRTLIALGFGVVLVGGFMVWLAFYGGTVSRRKITARARRRGGMLP